MVSLPRPMGVGMARTRFRATADLDGAAVPLAVGAGRGSWCLFFPSDFPWPLCLDCSTTPCKLS